MDTLLAFLDRLFFSLIWPILQFLIGLGVVVFFHELGHFLAARWAGIRVDRFALGFGPRLVGLKRGETDYCICAVPLGGYVKMLGQDDFKPAEDGQEVDPRSYMACPAGKRLVVIAAGVVMNVLLAAVLFILVCMIGMEFNAPVVGGTVPDYPAADVPVTWVEPAGIAQDAPTTQPMATSRPAPAKGLAGGDRLLTINGKTITRMSDLKMASILARTDPPETFRVRFERDIDGKAWIGEVDLPVQYNEALGAPQFGVLHPNTLTVDFNENQLVDSPLQTGDVVQAVDGRELAGQWDLDDLDNTLSGKAVRLAVRRGSETITFNRLPRVSLKPDVQYLADGSKLRAYLIAAPTERQGEGELPDPDNEDKHITVQPGQVAFQTEDGKIIVKPREDYVGGSSFSELDVLGLAPRMQVRRVNQLTPNDLWTSPAMKAGIRPGDILLAYGDRPTPTNLQFRQISNDVGEESTPLTVLRDGQPIDLTVRPEITDGQALVGISNGLDLQHMDVAYVRPNSPAAKAGLPAGAVLETLNGQPIANWTELVARLKDLGGREVTLTARLGNETKTYRLGKLSEDAFDPDDYRFELLPGVPFKPMMVLIQYRNPLKAVAWGAGETVNILLSTYQSLASMVRGSVSLDQARGPLGIGEIAVGAARQSLLNLVYLMAFLSTALAVFNFLPIPVLDGGHAVLIIIEKIRGKPLPVKLVNVIQMIFLVLILGFFLLVTYQDVSRWF